VKLLAGDPPSAHRPRSHPRLLLAVSGLFLGLTAWLCWPLPLRLGEGVSDSPDSLLNLWALAWNFHILPRDPLSLFQANIFFPRPNTLAYSEHLFGVALFAAPAYWASGNVVLAYNLALVLSFVLSGLGMFLLVFELTGSRSAALLSGVIYAFAPYRFLHVLHLQLLSSQWFPFVFFYLVRFLRDGRARQIALASAFALLQVLSCNYYALYLALALVLLALVLFLRGRDLLDRRKLGLSALGAAAVALLALPFFLPYEWNRAEQGFYRRYEDVVQFSAWPSDYLRPTALNDVFYASWLPPQLRSEKALFPGFAAAALALVGVALGRANDARAARILRGYFVLLVPVSFLLSLGPEIELGGETYFLPYRLFYQYVPGFSGLRVPARLAVLVVFGLSVLAGFGWARASRELFARKRLQTALGATVLGIVLFEYRTGSLDRIFPPAPASPPIYAWLAAQAGDFGVVELPMREGEDITRESLRMYHSIQHWKRLANGFSGWWPNDYWELVGRMRSFPNSRVLRFLEAHVPVRFVVVHYDDYSDRERERLEEAMGRYAGRLALRARFGADAVYEIEPSTPSDPAKP
jgi:hypothetical protein